ncbi:MAG TPA: hypothetical protein VGS80_04140 [Ktedonobacterales bacterium]|nr:hypothetical protein [Ktedonobacterales bacterium]
MSYGTDQAAYHALRQDYQLGSVNGRAVAGWDESRYNSAPTVIITYADDGREPTTVRYTFATTVNSGPDSAPLPPAG